MKLEFLQLELPFRRDTLPNDWQSAIRDAARSQLPDCELLRWAIVSAADSTLRIEAVVTVSPPEPQRSSGLSLP